MSYTCTTLGSVKRLGEEFDWYIFLLQDGLSDEFRSEIETNFDNLGEIAGPDAVVIRGYRPQEFRREVQEAYAGMLPRLVDVQPPALFVTDVAPARLDDPEQNGRFIVFSLQALMGEHGSTANFLSSLVDALRDPDALHALAGAEPGLLEGKWRWLAQYLKIKPSLFGFGVDGNRIAEDVAREFDTWWGGRSQA